MDSTFEIDTLNGVVSSTSSALAEAMAELIAAEYRAGEEDLLEAVSYDLSQVEVTGGVAHSVPAA